MFVWVERIRTYWGGVRELQPHVRAQNHGKLQTPPPPVRGVQHRPTTSY